MRFLVATDGSDPGDRALAFALDLAADAGATVTAVHSVEPAIHSEGASEPVRNLAEAERTLIVEDLADAEERAERILAEAERTATDRGAEIEPVLLYGPPEETIPDFAGDESFDLLVVGHRGLAERAERVLGSVAKVLVERSPVPVTVVR